MALHGREELATVIVHNVEPVGSHAQSTKNKSNTKFQEGVGANTLSSTDKTIVSVQAKLCHLHQVVLTTVDPLEDVSDAHGKIQASLISVQPPHPTVDVTVIAE